MDIERFGEIIDTFLEENEIRLVIDLPAGSSDAEIKDNCGIGPVPQLYIMLKGLVKVFDGFKECLKKECSDEFINNVLMMIRDEILEER